MPHLKTSSRATAVFAFLMATCTAWSDPLSKKTDIDFYRDVLSRDLHGLATRSDGRLVRGPGAWNPRHRENGWSGAALAGA
jgi:hypothetical protein